MTLKISFKKIRKIKNLFLWVMKVGVKAGLSGVSCNFGIRKVEVNINS